MRAKLLTHGQKIFDTYELLEMLLYYAIPYKDTNPIAKNLLARFGGLHGVLSASVDELVSVNGIGTSTAELLVKVGALKDILGGEIYPNNGLDGTDYCAMGDYLTEYFRDIDEPRVIGLFFDNNMRLLDMEVMYDLDFSSGGVKAKPFIDAAIRKRASVVVSAHHHPHGPFYPSQGDRATNELLTLALEMAGILHAEHYIVCGDSYSGINSVKKFSPKFSQSVAIDRFMKSKAAAISIGRELIMAMKSGDKGQFEENFLFKRNLNYWVSLLSTASREPQSLGKRTFDRYRTIEGTMTASVNELCELSDERCAAFIKLLAYVTARRSTDVFKQGCECTPDDIEKYLAAAYIGQSVEMVLLLSFDRRGRFISANILSEGTINTTDVLPRKALEIALSQSADSVILAHNHPFGTTRPSRDDMELTNLMQSVFATCDIKLKAHYVVAGQRVDKIHMSFD